MGEAVRKLGIWILFPPPPQCLGLLQIGKDFFGLWNKVCDEQPPNIRNSLNMSDNHPRCELNPNSNKTPIHPPTLSNLRSDSSLNENKGIRHNPNRKLRKPQQSGRHMKDVRFHTPLPNQTHIVTTAVHPCFFQIAKSYSVFCIVIKNLPRSMLIPQIAIGLSTQSLNSHIGIHPNPD